MEAIQWVALAGIAAAGIYLASRARGWKHRTLETMQFGPGEAVVHEDARARYATRPRSRGGTPRALAFTPMYGDATVRITNQRLVVGVPPLGQPSARIISVAIYRERVPEGARDALAHGYPSFSIAEPPTEEVRSDRVVFEIVAAPSDGSGIERVWIETTEPGPLRAFLGTGA